MARRSVQAPIRVSHHADAVPLHAILVGKIIDHERRGLAYHHWLLPRASFYGSRHRAVASPLLGVRQVRDSVEVRGNKLAPAFSKVSALEHLQYRRTVASTFQNLCLLEDAKAYHVEKAYHVSLSKHCMCVHA